jgi:hypothetical protein
VEIHRIPGYALESFVYFTEITLLTGTLCIFQLDGKFSKKEILQFSHNVLGAMIYRLVEEKPENTFKISGFEKIAEEMLTMADS